MVDSRTREEPRVYRGSGRSAAGGQRVQQAPPRRRPKRRHGILFKLYVFLVICSAIVVGLYIAHELLVQPPTIPQSETTAPDTGDTALPVADPEDPNALVRRDGVYNFVLLGKDVDSSNTDTIILVSFDTVQGKIGMISIPRDTAVNRTWTKQTPQAQLRLPQRRSRCAHGGDSAALWSPGGLLHPCGLEGLYRPGGRAGGRGH